MLKQRKLLLGVALIPTILTSCQSGTTNKRDIYSPVGAEVRTYGGIDREGEFGWDFSSYPLWEEYKKIETKALELGYKIVEEKKNMV